MIEITCSREEKERLIEVLTLSKCPFGDKCKDPEFYQYGSCEECVKFSIKWKLKTEG